MKNINLKLSSLAIVILMTSSCILFKDSPIVYEIDPVCHMKVDKSEAFTYKYKDVEYYFESINCQKIFKMDPENILIKNNSCETKK